MAFEQLKFDDQENGYVPNRKSVFILDSDSDLNSLPSCRAGSIAYTADFEHVYVMSPSGTWTTAI